MMMMQRILVWKTRAIITKLSNIYQSNVFSVLKNYSSIRGHLNLYFHPPSCHPIAIRFSSKCLDFRFTALQDLNRKLCQKSGKPCKGKCNPREDTGSVTDSARPLHIVAQRAQWFKPTTLESLYALLKQYWDQNYRLVFGNTGYGQSGIFVVVNLLDDSVRSLSLSLSLSSSCQETNLEYRCK